MSFGTRGLELEQAPSLDLPVRFFLTAPLFVTAAGLLFAWDGEALLASRWTPAALAVVHLLTVGFLGQVMCGALLQMLPVVAGAPVPRVRLVGSWVHLLLSFGGATLAWGLWRGGEIILAIGGALSALGFLFLLGPVSVALIRARGTPHTVRAMRIAVGALAVTVLLGLLLTSALTGWVEVPNLVLWADIHAGTGLMGWVGILILGIAFQVVPMFYVTRPYPQALRKWLAPVIITAIGVGALSWLIHSHLTGVLLFGVAIAGFVLFAAATMRLLSLPGRRRAEATRLHWWTAMSMICVAGTAWALSAPAQLVGVLLLVGVGVGLPTGMLLKILPFLSWFHLQHLQMASGRLDVRVPYMQGFISERFARFHLALHLSTLAILATAVMLPGLALVGGVLLCLSGLVLEVILLMSVLRYSRVALSLKTTMVPSSAEPG